MLLRFADSPAPYGWSPAALAADLKGWWDAERTDLITQSGGLVSSWLDIVNGTSAAQAVGAAKPVLSATSFNGRPGITFDGTDDELTFAGVPGGWPAAGAAGEIWALCDQVALVADVGDRNIFTYGGGGNNTRYMARVVSGGANRAYTSTGTGAGAPAIINTSVDFSGRHVVRSQFTASVIQCDVDGNASTTAAAVSSTNTTRGRIGAGSTGSPLGFMNGVLSTVLVTAPLTAGQAALLYGFLNARR